MRQKGKAVRSSPVIDLHSQGILQQPDEVWEAVHASSIAKNETLQPQQGLQSQRQYGIGLIR